MNQFIMDQFMTQLGLVLTFVTLPIIVGVLSYHLGHMVGFEMGSTSQQRPE